MNDEEQSRTKQWILGWRNAGAMLRKLKKSELAEIETATVVQRLARVFESCRIHFKPSQHSGLVEQQRWFQKLRQ
jgi:hypothetical protein